METDPSSSNDTSPYAGSGLLAAVIKRRDLSLREAAEQIGVSKTSLIHWLRGEQRPDDARGGMRDAVAKWTDGEVPFESWDRPGEEIRPVDRVQPFVPAADPVSGDPR